MVKGEMLLERLTDIALNDRIGRHEQEANIRRISPHHHHNDGHCTNPVFIYNEADMGGLRICFGVNDACVLCRAGT